jgi:hypothetical protein
MSEALGVGLKRWEGLREGELRSEGGNELVWIAERRLPYMMSYIRI